MTSRIPQSARNSGGKKAQNAPKGIFSFAPSVPFRGQFSIRNPQSAIRNPK
jgi:hypothetical protein